METVLYKEPYFLKHLVSLKPNVFILEDKKEIPFSDFEMIRKGINQFEENPFIFEFDSTKDLYIFTKGNQYVEKNDPDIYSEEGVLYEKLNYMIINNLSQEDICLNLESNYLEEIDEHKNITTVSFFLSMNLEQLEFILNKSLEKYLRKRNYALPLDTFIQVSNTFVVFGSSFYELTLEENKLKLKRRSLS